MKELYSGKILVKFGEANHRYTVSTDGGQTWDYKPGVTTIIGNTLAKPMLMLWPMDEALKYLFGQNFEERLEDDGSVLVTPVYYAAKALLQPNQSYTLGSLQTALEQARSAHMKKRDKGGDTGHIVHKAIENYLTTQARPSLSKEADKSFSAFVGWFENQNIEVLGTEQIVYSEAFDYCGTFDALLNIGGKRILVDVKTSNYSRTAPKGIYADNFIQLGAYALAYEEEHGEGTVDDCLVINCSKQGRVNAQYASELGYSPTALMNLFTPTLHLYNGKKKIEKMLTRKEVKT